MFSFTNKGKTIIGRRWNASGKSDLVGRGGARHPTGAGATESRQAPSQSGSSRWSLRVQRALPSRFVRGPGKARSRSAKEGRACARTLPACRLDLVNFPGFGRSTVCSGANLLARSLADPRPGFNSVSRFLIGVVSKGLSCFPYPSYLQDSAKSYAGAQVLPVASRASARSDWEGINFHYTGHY